jgi:hypothetical protein
VGDLVEPADGELREAIGNNVDNARADSAN